MDRAAFDFAKRQLQPGERLIWTGRPVAERMSIGLLGGAVAVSLKMGVLTGALAIVGAALRVLLELAFGEIAVSAIPRAATVYLAISAGLSILVFVLFFLMGATLVPFVALVQRRTVYAITSRRLLVLRNLPFLRPKALSLGSAVFTVEPGRRPNAGSVIFMQAIVKGGVGESDGVGKSKIEFAFRDLPDIRPVRHAFEQARQLAERAAE